MSFQSPFLSFPCAPLGAVWLTSFIVSILLARLSKAGIHTLFGLVIHLSFMPLALTYKDLKLTARARYGF